MSLGMHFVVCFGMHFVMRFRMHFVMLLSSIIMRCSRNRKGSENQGSSQSESEELFHLFVHHPNELWSYESYF